ncbi:hypothetical protein [Rhodocyclus purpureus]|uniref:hypothetical protein n=1 Tax=Rhodocyclus purpureus TaxID=1067 RepID=UPI0019141C80|nr:hypothetical protein [Rhodocyclus purpureus]MBK5914297.1 hypothetical protein [Rhodocyclus purpureus]
MKIHQLPQGARFEYEGEEYVKTGPMLATGKGGVRLIPKYAVLKPVGEVEAARETPKGGAIAREKLLAAFATFYAECQSLVPEERQSELRSARVRFLEAIGQAA